MNNTEIFFHLEINKFEIIILDTNLKEITYKKAIFLKSREYDYKGIISEINYIFKELIIEIEKKINQSINKINLIVESPYTLKINACIKKNFDNFKVSKGQIEYLVQDLKQQISENIDHKRINHIIIKELLVDNEKVDYSPINQSCNDIIVDVEFICLPNNLLDLLEILFRNHQIEFSSILCSHYTKSFINSEFENIYVSALALKDGYNAYEVSISAKKPVKMGFFEKLFNIFS